MNERVNDMQDDRVSVSICCVTFNQAAYIEDAIKSFLSQKVSFPIEILIHDDASTDGTSEIVGEYARRYPDLIRPFIEVENQYAKTRTYHFGPFAMNARGRYVAICEGDDYWTDPNKLQKQFDYMESHQDCSEYCHAAKVLDGNTGAELGIMGMGDRSRALTPQDVIEQWQIPSASRMYRKKNFEDYCEEWTFPFPAGDFPAAVYSLTKGYIYYSAEPMSVYRYRSVGSWTSTILSQEGENALKWLRMLEDIDKATDGAFRDSLLKAARNYYCSYIAYDPSGEGASEQFLSEVDRLLSPMERQKASLKKILRIFGLKVGSEGWGPSAKKRLMRCG